MSIHPLKLSLDWQRNGILLQLCAVSLQLAESDVGFVVFVLAPAGAAHSAPLADDATWVPGVPLRRGALPARHDRVEGKVRNVMIEY